MHRIDSAFREQDKFGAGLDGWTEGDPGVTPATEFTEDWLDEVQEEIANVIEGNGGTLSKGTRTQLRDILRNMVGAAGGPALKGTGGTGNANGIEGYGTGTGAGVDATGGDSDGAGIVATGGATNGHGAEIYGTGSGSAAYIRSNGTGAGINVVGGSSDAPAISATGGTTDGVGIQAQGTGAGGGVSGIGGATGVGLYAQGGSTSGRGAYIEAQAGNSDGAYILGIGAGNGVEAVGGTTGNGVQGTGGSTSGYGVYGVSTVDHGVVAQGDTTSPAKSAFRIVPQDALPTGPNAVGDLCVLSTDQKLYLCTVAGSPGTWTAQT